MAEKTLNLYQKLAKIRAMSDVVSKEKRGYNYTYTDILEILSNVTAGMKQYGVSLIPAIVPGTSSVAKNEIVNTKFDKTGKVYDQKNTEFLFTAEMIFRWVNDDNPTDYIEIPWFVTGSMSDCAQAVGAGLTYTLRQFLTNYFQIAQTNDDIDAYRSKQKEAEVLESKAIAEQIIAEFDKIVREYLAGNPDKGDEVKKFVSKYAKDGKYQMIKEPALASNLMENFKNKFLGGK